MPAGGVSAPQMLTSWLGAADSAGAFHVGPTSAALSRALRMASTLMVVLSGSGESSGEHPAKAATAHTATAARATLFRTIRP
jgi:hypothetical protein